MNKQYRIVKKSWRHDEDGSIRHAFHLEYLGSTAFGSPKWKPVTKLMLSLEDVHTFNVIYSDQEDAIKHLNNLQVPVPENEVLPLFSYQETDEKTAHKTQ